MVNIIFQRICYDYKGAIFAIDSSKDTSLAGIIERQLNFAIFDPFMEKHLENIDTMFR
jgi:hypothetical protein